MRKIMGKSMAALVAAALLTLTGCEGNLLPKSRDITTVELMQVLALDEGENGTLSVTAASGVHSGGQNGDPQPPVILEREAPTVFAACMSIQSDGNGYASFGHMEQCVLSARVAQRSMSSLLDFLERDPEMRLDAHLYVTEQEPAAELLKAVSDENRSATERLEAIGRELSVQSFGWPVTVREFMIDMEENGCGLMPLLTLTEEEQEKAIQCGSMGWFQEGDYKGALTQGQSRAAAMLEGKLGSSAVEVRLSDGGLAGLRLTEVKCKWKPIWSGQRLAGVDVSVDVKADLAELQGDTNLYSERTRKELLERMETQLKREIQELLELSQKEGADFLHIEREVRLQCPAQYRRLEEHWAEWFPALNLNVEVQGIIERSYDLNQSGAAA